MAVQPIFIFSAPRSGSTLLQRIIAAHDGVATVSEPWLLLPHIYSFRRSGIVAEYPHPRLADALEDFSRQLPDGLPGYRRELHDLALRLYEQAAGDARYFVDKSPPYHFVASDVMQLFPEGKFVFLWRNPLSILASLVETWLDGEWRPLAFRQQLFVGLPRLAPAYSENRAAAYAVRYEDLLDGDARDWEPLMSYLGIEFQPETLSRFSDVRLQGRMGDPTGIKQYQALDSAPKEKWAQTIDNPLRREWCRRYLRFLGRDRLATMGYDYERLQRDLHDQPSRYASIGSDLKLLVGDLVKEPVRARVNRGRLAGPNAVAELLRPERQRV
jgi:hypothetical protein